MHVLFLFICIFGRQRQLQTHLQLVAEQLRLLRYVPSGYIGTKILIVSTFNEQNIHKQVITTVTVCKNMSHLRRNPCHWSRHCCCSNNSMIDGNHNNFNGTETYICLRPRLGRRIFCYRCPNHAGWDRSLHFCCVLHPQKKS